MSFGMNSMWAGCTLNDVQGIEFVWDNNLYHSLANSADDKVLIFLSPHFFKNAMGIL